MIGKIIKQQCVILGGATYSKIIEKIAWQHIVWAICHPRHILFLCHEPKKHGISSTTAVLFSCSDCLIGFDDEIGEK